MGYAKPLEQDPETVRALPQLATVERLRQTSNLYWEAVWFLRQLENDEDVTAGMSREQKHRMRELCRKAGF